MDITILDNPEKRFRVINTYPELQLDSNYSDILDPDSVFWWDPDQLNSGQRFFYIRAQSYSDICEIRDWLLKNSYSGVKLFGEEFGGERSIDWSLDDFARLDRLGESILLNILSPKFDLRLTIKKKEYRKFVSDYHRLLSDLGMYNVYVLIKSGRASGMIGNEFILKQ